MFACPSCSADIPPGSRFCPGCGARLAERSESHHGSTLLGGSSLLTSAESAIDRSSSASAFDHGQFVPGTVLVERYRIVGLLAKGGMGEVYRADDLKLGQSVALKFLPRRLAGKEDRLERFHHEVRLARQVSHPNVCRVYDIGEVDGAPYISMEYIDGEDLASLIRRIGRLPRSKAIEIARQLCAGLSAAHERGILHRDLKPRNVMIDGRGRVRITDFGLAALADEAIGADVRAGTPAYMAPEQLLGREVSIRSDVYSLGLVLYEAFTGQKAFDAITIEDLRKLHAEQIPRLPSQIVEDFDAAVERVLMHCLERDPRERPASMLSVSAALPGGDPLAAALAAGETPSPELVAAAAHKEGMPPVVCLAALVVILLGIVAFPFLNDQIKLHSFVALEKRPEVLADRARDILRRLRYADKPVDSAYGFAVNAEYLSRIEDFDQSTLRWSSMAAGGPPAIDFWYRESPVVLVTSNASGMVTESNPPIDVPGMISMRLSPSGTLLSLTVLPPARETAAESRPAMDWSVLFSEAELPEQRFNSTENRWVPPVHSDSRHAWRGPHPGNADIPLRIEAASYNGRPTFFRVAPDWPETWSVAQRDSRSAQAIGQVINVSLFVASLIGAVVLAQRNLMLNRGDRRGAWRISVFIACCMLSAWLLQASHVANPDGQRELFSRAVGQALFTAGLCWVFYVALEPHLRRRWPDMLISWNRLLRGRIRDPLVGRDILIGGLFGLFGMIALALRYFGPGWFGSPPPRPADVPTMTFLGLRFNVAHLLDIVVTNALFQPMLVLVVLLLLLVLLRTRWLALTVFYSVVTALMTLVSTQTGGNLFVNLGFFGLMVLALLFVLIRFGLLALMFGILFAMLLNGYPITADIHAWYRDSSWFALATLCALTFFGFHTALAGRPLFVPTAVQTA